tara:strand:+ start:2989 stop:3195 length:207 start_codon:yes stop_codon:yes gene_type:complete
MDKHIFEKPISQEAYLVALHTVGFDTYLKKLGKMYNIPKEQFLSALKDDQEVRDEIIGNFYKSILESK